MILGTGVFQCDLRTGAAVMLPSKLSAKGMGVGFWVDGDGMGHVGRRQKGMVMPVSARDQELDLLRPNVADLQHQV